MANKALFKSLVGKLLPKTDTVNEAGGQAYAFTPEHALAQYALTGCMNQTFYASAEEQLEQVLKLAQTVAPEFLARTALYAREQGFMKDMPAMLCAVLATRDSKLFELVFDRVIDNGKMLRNVVQILRSGAVGRKSLGTVPKRKVRQWLEKRSDDAVFRASVGQDPSLGDILKLAHPKPGTASREALYGYLIGKPYKEELLPELVKAFEAFKGGATQEVPDVPFQLLTSLPLGKEAWSAIARQASWTTLRMNLNTFMRHKVFEDPKMVALVAEKLKDAKAVRYAKAFPYQLLMAYKATNSGMPLAITEALQDAMEVAVSNVPALEGQVYVCPDVSGSMGSPVTGYRQGSTTAVRCIDVAGLMAAAILRANPRAEVLPFEVKVVDLKLNPRDSVMTNAQKLASIGGGGTACSAPLAVLNGRKAKGDLVVIVSDNESWADSRQGGRGTAMMKEWEHFRARNPQARLVCIDIQPVASTQAIDREDVLNVGGFSDRVFDVVATFARGELKPGHFVGKINDVSL